MDFSFGRQSSREAGGEGAESGSSGSSSGLKRGGSLRSSFSEGSSRFLGALGGAKNGLIDGLSSGITQVGGLLKKSDEPQSDSSQESYTQASRGAGSIRSGVGTGAGGVQARSAGSAFSPGTGAGKSSTQQYQQKPQQKEQQQQQFPRARSKAPPPKPPAPRRSANGALRQYSADPSGEYSPRTPPYSHRQGSLPATRGGSSFEQQYYAQPDSVIEPPNITDVAPKPGSGVVNGGPGPIQPEPRTPPQVHRSPDHSHLYQQPPAAEPPDVTAPTRPTTHTTVAEVHTDRSRGHPERYRYEDPGHAPTASEVSSQERDYYSPYGSQERNQYPYDSQSQGQPKQPTYDSRTYSQEQVHYQDQYTSQPQDQGRDQYRHQDKTGASQYPYTTAEQDKYPSQGAKDTHRYPYEDTESSHYPYQEDSTQHQYKDQSGDKDKYSGQQPEGVSYQSLERDSQQYQDPSQDQYGYKDKTQDRQVAQEKYPQYQDQTKDTYPYQDTSSEGQYQDQDKDYYQYQNQGKQSQYDQKDRSQYQSSDPQTDEYQRKEEAFAQYQQPEQYQAPQKEESPYKYQQQKAQYYSKTVDEPYPYQEKEDYSFQQKEVDPYQYQQKEQYQYPRKEDKPYQYQPKEQYYTQKTEEDTYKYQQKDQSQDSRKEEQRYPYQAKEEYPYAKTEEDPNKYPEQSKENYLYDSKGQSQYQQQKSGQLMQGKTEQNPYSYQKQPEQSRFAYQDITKQDPYIHTQQQKVEHPPTKPTFTKPIDAPKRKIIPAPQVSYPDSMTMEYTSNYPNMAMGDQKGQIGGDLLPGIPRVPSINNPPGGSVGGGMLGAPQQDLLAITPTSGEALPMPNIEPSHGDPVSDAESSATEGCDELENDDFAVDEKGYGGYIFRSGSVGSDKSWSSSYSDEALMDDMSTECMNFMKDFVNKIFHGGSMTPMDKAKYGQLCQQGPGRLWFARYVNAQRVDNKKVDEQPFYQLVQFFAICLFECKEEEDYGPAKTLMNMCFTFYYEEPRPKTNIFRQALLQFLPWRDSLSSVRQSQGPDFKHFLYSYLKDQSIWQSIRFWNAAFFDAVQNERRRKPVCTRGEGSAARSDDREFQENITFGQLGTFTCNMRAFGLNKDLCLEFLRKQSTIANLREEQVNMLRENVERWTD